MKDFQIMQRTTADGQIVALPVASISGTKSGPTMAIVAAVHGCEFCGIEATIRLFKNLKPKEMAGSLRMVMTANLPSFRARTMYRCPIDGGNVGRAFPGSPTGTYSELIGHTIWKEVAGDAGYVLDLHGGDLIEHLTQYIGYFTTGDPELDQRTEGVARAFGAQNIEVRPLPPATENLSLSQAASHAGKVGLLVEAGSQGRRDEKDVLFHYHGVLNVMRHIGMLKGAPEKPKHKIRWMDEFIGVKANAEGIFYPLVEANDVVEAGQLIGHIRSFTSELLEEVKSPSKSVVLGVITPASTYQDSTLFGLGRLKK